MGAAPISGPSERIVEENFIFNNKKIYSIDKCQYYETERSEFKLNISVLKSFDRKNKFSKDNDKEIFANLK